eukprot:357832-Chlamydomonas_euryale.AAC.8
MFVTAGGPATTLPCASVFICVDIRGCLQRVLTATKNCQKQSQAAFDRVSLLSAMMRRMSSASSVTGHRYSATLPSGDSRSEMLRFTSSGCTGCSTIMSHNCSASSCA